MKKADGIDLKDVQAVYSGPEGRLWELVMGEQIHIGGLSSSIDLAQKAGISGDMAGVDLCCCNGAGMRFLVRFFDVSSMIGVDATEAMVECGRERCAEEGFDRQISFVLGDACASGLPSQTADFIWGEDAWCYVADKNALLREAARIVKPGGTIAFTDWVEGPTPLASAEAERVLRFMKFPTIYGLAEYREQLVKNDCKILHAENTGRFYDYAALYLGMLKKQLTYDVLKMIGFRRELMTQLIDELEFMVGLARSGKVAQALLVAKKE